MQAEFNPNFKSMIVTILLIALAVLLFAICFKAVEFFEKI
ncbi:hypothetical protein IWX80_002710 [Flavobacterium sp. CAN_S2]